MTITLTWHVQNLDSTTSRAVTDERVCVGLLRQAGVEPFKRYLIDLLEACEGSRGWYCEIYGVPLQLICTTYIYGNWFTFVGLEALRL